MAHPVVDPQLFQFCTVRQLEVLEAIEKHGSQRAAAKALGTNKSTINHAMDSVKRKAAQQGYSPDYDMKHIAPEGFKVKGVSTYYDREGKPAAQWVKTNEDAERREELLRIALATLSEEVRGLAPIGKAPKRCFDDLLVVYPLGDPHFGMHAWAKECGENFDLKEARRVTLGAVDRLVQAAPAAATAIILPLGDVFHANDQSNQTPQHKNQLDVDSRYVKILQVGILTFRHAILRSLEKHARVFVRFVPGNHDPQAIWALAFSIAAYFDNEPRVEVDLSPSAFWYFHFGKVLIGATHGDTAKTDQLPGVMACDKAEVWGVTKHRYWYTGHIHNQTVKEFPGVTCESFRTLAAQDSYAAGHGYRAGRDMRAIIHHKEYGEIERHRCDIGMIEPAELTDT